MSSGADSCAPDSDQDVVFVESGTDWMVQGANVEDAALLYSDAASAEKEAMIKQTSSNIPCHSVAEASDCDTAVTMMSSVRENDSSLQASKNPSEKQNVIVCKLIHNGGRWCFYYSSYLVL